MNHADYLYAIDPQKRAKAVSWAVQALQSLEFDSIVVCGFSGVSIGCIVANILGKPICYVRKKDEKAHSEFSVEYGEKIGKYVIIDDLIVSGDTLRYILARAYDVEENSECIGLAAYTNDAFYNKEYLGCYLSPQQVDKYLKPIKILDASAPPSPIPYVIDTETTPLNNPKDPYTYAQSFTSDFLQLKDNPCLVRISND